MARILVTGGTGVIGTALVRRLLADGEQVVGLARSEAAAAALKAMGAEARFGDLADLDGLSEAAAAADGVIHLAFNHDEMRSGNMAARSLTVAIPRRCSSAVCKPEIPAIRQR